MHFEDLETSEDREDLQRDQDPTDFVWRAKYREALRHFERRHIKNANVHLRVHAEHREQGFDSNSRGPRHQTLPI